MLEYSDADLEDVFMQTFKISYEDVFGSVIDHQLKENGDEIKVTQDNKYVSVFFLVFRMSMISRLKI